MRAKLNIKILIYHFFFRFFTSYIAANNTRLGIPAAQVTALNNLYAAWVVKFDLYVDPETFGTATISDINGAYNADYPYTEGVKNQIKNNPTVVLTGIDHLVLDIPFLKPRRGHVPVPTIRPGITCISKAPFTLSFFVFDPEQPAKKGKPVDVTSIGIKMVVVAADAPEPRPEAYILQTPENKTMFEKLFTTEQVGMKLYIKAFYLNARNEAGPDGDPTGVDIV